jgi:hypothetical protein
MIRSIGVAEWPRAKQLLKKGKAQNQFFFA